MLIRGKLADHVGSEEDGTTVDKIARKVGMNADKLTRVLRYLACMDIFTEVAERRFRITSLGSVYKSDSLLFPTFETLYVPIPSSLMSIAFGALISRPMLTMP